jgi:hypothetical protein
LHSGSPPTHNAISAHVTSAWTRVIRRPADIVRLGIDTVFREHSALLDPDFPAGCEIQAYMATKSHMLARFRGERRMPNTTSNLSQLIHEQDAAVRLGVSISTLRRWRRAGTGPRFVRFSRLVFYRPEDLDNFVGVHLSKPSGVR